MGKIHSLVSCFRQSPYSLVCVRAGITLGYLMLAYCPHSEAEMTVAGILSPFDRVEVIVMPAGSHEREMGELVRGHSAVVQWQYLLQLGNTCTSLSNTWVGL